MAIAISIGLGLVTGVAFMFNTQYFWGKEDNANIATINSTLTSFNTFFNVTAVLIIVIAALAILGYVSCLRGF